MLNLKTISIMSWNSSIDHTQDQFDNHSDILNPNNDSYWESRGFDERPDDWEDHQQESANNDNISHEN
jgi:hypothetical protein